MTRTYRPIESRRYPYRVADLDQLRAELRDVDWLGIAHTKAGWLCAWLDEPGRVVRWDDAARLAAGARRGKAA